MIRRLGVLSFVFTACTASAEPSNTPPTTPVAKAKPSADEAPDRDSHAMLLFPTIRIGMGGGIHPHSGGGATGSFNFDAGVGFRFPVARRFGLWPELAYSSATDDFFGGKFMAVGIGPLYGTSMLAVGWSPRFVLGAARGELAIGPRNSLMGSVLYNILTLEIGHQWLHTTSRDDHEFRFMLALDVAPICGFFLAAHAVSTVAGSLSGR